MEPVKLTEDEIKQLKELEEKSGSIVRELGLISLQELALKDRKQAASEFLTNLKEEENYLARYLQDKYGQGSINLAEGVFMPAPSQE